jgi:hypothetical protein
MIELQIENAGEGVARQVIVCFQGEMAEADRYQWVCKVRSGAIDKGCGAEEASANPKLSISTNQLMGIYPGEGGGEVVVNLNRRSL